MKYPISILIILIFLCHATATAQKPLPAIAVKNINGKVIISWINQYHRIAKVIKIQRSDDSLKDYSTICTVLNPENIDNGYADVNPPKLNLFYRVFVSFGGSSYVFSEIKRAGKDSNDATLTPGDNIALLGEIPAQIKHSNHVYVARENNVMINLPDAAIKKYAINFFDEKNKLVFTLTKLKETELIIEKVNFVHAGWYFYEVVENGKLIEKDKFYLPADNKIQTGTTNEKDKKRK